MFEDLVKSIKAQLYERVSSPLISTFVLSWSVWNYKLLCVILSKTPASEKIVLIDSLVEIDWYFLKGIIAPIITTLMFIFIYPYPAKFVYEFSRKRQKELKEIKQKIEDETPLTKEESRAIKIDFYLLKKEYEKLMDEKESELKLLKNNYEDQISTLQNTLDLANKTISGQIKSSNNASKILDKKNKSIIDKVNYGSDNDTFVKDDDKFDNNSEASEIKIKILKIIGMGSSIDTNAIIKAFSGNINKVRIELMLDQLQQEGFISQSVRGHFLLTNKARTYLVEKNIL